MTSRGPNCGPTGSSSIRPSSPGERIVKGTKLAAESLVAEIEKARATRRCSRPIPN